MALFQLIYMSSLTLDDAQTLPGIMDVSVRNNTLRNITGMMLYADGNILQVLEGEQDVVQATFRAIQSDLRHHGVFVLIEAEIAQRQFAQWSMGFRHLTPVDLAKLPAAAPVFKAHRDELALRVQPSDALIILKSFAQGSMGIF